MASKLTGFTVPYIYGGSHSDAPLPTDAAPVNTTAPHIAGSAMPGGVLSTDNGLWSGQPAPSFTRQWMADGAPLPGEVGVSLIVSMADLGKAITCVVTAANTMGTASAGSNTLIIGAAVSAPVNTVTPSITGGTIIGSVLSVDYGSWTGQPTPTLTNQWRRDGLDITGATGTSYTTTNADDGKVITCRVIAVNSQGTATATSNGLAITGAIVPPVNTSAPAVTGSPVVGSALTCSQGVWSGTPAPTFAYQWLRDGATVAGATTSTYTTVAGDVGKGISCRVTATNTGGTSSRISNAIAVIASSTLPANTVLPTVTGASAAGSVLTSTTGTWTGSPTPTYTFQWRANGVDINGATNATYTTLVGQIGAVITCRVVASNAAGAVGAVSNGVTVVAAQSAPVNTAVPTITGSPIPGNTLSTTSGTWTGDPAPTFARQWLANGVAIPGETGITYAVVAGDVGKAISYSVTASNSQGTATAASAAVTIVEYLGSYTQARMVIKQTHGGMAARIGTLEFLPSSGPKLTGTPFASSTMGAQYVAANAFDATTTSVWSPAIGDTAPTIGLDFGSAQSLASIAVTYSGQHVDAWEDSPEWIRFEATTNGTDWTVIGEFKTEDVWNDGQRRVYTMGTPVTPSAPVNTASPALTGNPWAGQAMVSSTGSWDGTPAPTFAYQWRFNGTPISGATASSYTVTSGNEGKLLTCLVTATNASGTASSASTAATIVAAPVTPANTVAPVVSGGTAPGVTLTTTTGTWTGSPAPTYTYQWQRDGVAIAGQTASTYVVLGGDDAKVIRCLVTATNASGSASQASNGVTIVAPNSAPFNVNPPVISGAVVGTASTVTTGDWTGKPTPTFAYQWKADTVAISGATAASYTPVIGDATKTLTCTVTATNSQGSAGVTSAGIVVAASAGQAAFDPSYKSSVFTLSDSNRTAENTAGASGAVHMGGSFRTSGKYWIEILMTSGAGVEFYGLGIGSSTFFETMLGRDAKSILFYRDEGDKITKSQGGVATEYPMGAGVYTSTGDSLFLLVDLDNKQLFFGHTQDQLYGTPSIHWATADPKVSPLGGVPIDFADAVRPGYYCYYSGVVATLPGESDFKHYATLCPSGVTKGWPA